MNLAAWSVAHLLLLTTFLAAVLYLATDSEPLDVEHVAVTAPEKRRLVEMIKHAAHDRTVDDTGETREIRLSENEVKTLFAWGLETLGMSLRRPTSRVSAYSRVTYSNVPNCWRKRAEPPR